MPALLSKRTNDVPDATLGLRSIFRDRWIITLLTLGFLFRLAIAVGLHIHFQHANPAHLWSGTDEATYYTFGLNSANLLKSDGWNAFLQSPPASAYFNWLFFKYTGLTLYVFGDSPMVLRLLSIVFGMLGTVFFLFAFAASLPLQIQRRFFVALMCLFPSYAFWSALAIKEGLISMLTGLFCWGLACFWSKTKPWPVLAWTAVLCMCLGSLRIWAGLAFFCVTAPVILLAHPAKPKPLYLLPLGFAVLAALWMTPHVQLIITNMLGWEMDPALKYYYKRFNFFENRSFLDGQHYPMPMKVALAFLLPLPLFSAGSLLMTLGSIENCFFLVLVCLATAGIFQKISCPELIWLGMMLIIILVAITFGTSLGTIYRDKMASLPFIAYFAACALPHSLDSFRCIFRLRSKL